MGGIVFLVFSVAVQGKRRSSGCGSGSGSDSSGGSKQQQAAASKQLRSSRVAEVAVRLDPLLGPIAKGVFAFTYQHLLHLVLQLGVFQKPPKCSFQTHFVLCFPLESTLFASHHECDWNASRLRLAAAALSPAASADHTRDASVSPPCGVPLAAAKFVSLPAAADHTFPTIVSFTITRISQPPRPPRQKLNNPQPSPATGPPSPLQPHVLILLGRCLQLHLKQAAADAARRCSRQLRVDGETGCRARCVC